MNPLQQRESDEHIRKLLLEILAVGLVSHCCLSFRLTASLIADRARDKESRVMMKKMGVVSREIRLERFRGLICVRVVHCASGASQVGTGARQHRPGQTTARYVPRLSLSTVHVITSHETELVPYFIYDEEDEVEAKIAAGTSTAAAPVVPAGTAGTAGKNMDGEICTRLAFVFADLHCVRWAFVILQLAVMLTAGPDGRLQPYTPKPNKSAPTDSTATAPDSAGTAPPSAVTATSRQSDPQDEDEPPDLIPLESADHADGMDEMD